MLTMSKEEQAAAVRKAAQDYWESWYEGDAERMGAVLRPELAKRHMKHDYEKETDRLVHITREMMVDATREGEGTATPADHRPVKLDVLDVYQTVATVRCEAWDYVEYLHLVNADGRWQIVNTLYTTRREHR